MPRASSRRAGRWGRPTAALAAGCALVALALVGAGCGSQERANDPRPQPPTRVSVTITPHSITVQPPRIAVGPEPNQQIPQNKHAGQPPIRSRAPVDVAFVTANLTDSNSRLEIHGPRDATSDELVANGNGTLLTALPTGVYTVRATGIPGAKPARFTVGPYRTSSQNDLLLP